MITISIHEIQRDPLGYLRRVEEGETSVVLRDERPVVELKPCPLLTLQPRPFGLCVGQFRVPDDFDRPLPDVIIKEFVGAPLRKSCNWTSIPAE
jgi:antitoxin (DNA-binding transcriptional repressor) of toxin-antitoxin stability system